MAHMRDDAHSASTISRRTILKSVAASALVAAPVSVTTPHPDAELLTAFEDWKRANIIAENLPEDMGDEERDPYWEPVWGAVRRMKELPARTPAGMAVKLRYLFASLGELTESYEAIWYGTHPSDELLSDSRYRMLWDLIADAETMDHGGQHAV